MEKITGTGSITCPLDSVVRGKQDSSPASLQAFINNFSVAQFLHMQNKDNKAGVLELREWDDMMQSFLKKYFPLNWESPKG